MEVNGFHMSKVNKAKKNIVVTGGSGRFGSYLKKNTGKYKMFFPSKSELNITNLNSVIDVNGESMSINYLIELINKVNSGEINIIEVQVE